MKQIITIICTTIIMSGCSVYKTYQRPQELYVASSYRDSNSNDSTTIATLSWREFFTDTILCNLIEKGLRSNIDMNIARLRTQQAEALLLSSRLAYLPSVGVAADGGVSSLGGSKSTMTYSLAATASWEIDIFGKLTNAKEGAKAAYESSQAYHQAVQTSLIATIANSYYSLLMYDKMMQTYLQTVDSWNRTIKTLEALKRAGRSDDVAILRAKANLFSAESSIVQIRQSINEIENSLSVLLEQEPQAIERSVIDNQRFPDNLAIGVPLELLSLRPDVRQAEYDLAEAFYATNAARSAFYPSLSLSGSAGWTNSAGGVVLDPAQLLLSAAVSLAQPIFNNGKNKTNLKIAKSKQEEALLQFNHTILKAGQEVNDALAQWQSAKESIVFTGQQIAALEQAVYKTEVMLKYSSSNYLEVLTAQQSLLSAELSQTQNQFSEIQGIITLYHALGGGVE